LFGPLFEPEPDPLLPELLEPAAELLEVPGRLPAEHPVRTSAASKMVAAIGTVFFTENFLWRAEKPYRMAATS
jgi:hypothetical protein